MKLERIKDLDSLLTIGPILGIAEKIVRATVIRLVQRRQLPTEKAELTMVRKLREVGEEGKWKEVFPKECWPIIEEMIKRAMEDENAYRVYLVVGVFEESLENFKLYLRQNKKKKIKKDDALIFLLAVYTAFLADPEKVERKFFLKTYTGWEVNMEELFG